MISASGPIGRLRARLGALVRRYRYGSAALDQAAVSMFGFALNLVLVRVLAVSDYGVVVLWMTIGLLAISIQNALVSTPLSVHLNAERDPQRARRLGETLAVVNLIVVGLVTLAIVLVNLCVAAAWTPRDTIEAVAIPLFVAAGLFREYYRSLAFSRNDMAMLLRTDVPYVAVTGACLVAMLLWPRHFASVAAALLAMSLGALASRLCLSGQVRGAPLHPFRRGWVQEYRRLSHDTGWALIGVLTTHAHSRAYLYVAVDLVGLAGLATINVVGILFRPVRLLMTAWNRSALPELAAQLAAGRLATFDRAIARAFGLAAVGSGVWLVVLWGSWALIERYFLAGHYPDAPALVMPWAIAAALEAMGAALATALQAARDFKFLAYASLVSAPVTLAATVGAVLWHGYTWTMYGVAIGNLVVLVMMASRLRVVRRQTAARAVAPTRLGGTAAASPTR